jgi:amino acid transporter
VAPVALRKAASLPSIDGASDLPESSWYSVKRRLLGPPLVNEQLRVERLSKPLGLGVLSCDGISSANYGSELILHELLPFFGIAAFSLLLPMTGVILLGIGLVVLSYREVVSVYTRAGGSYVVARENFGPRIAQVAAVALMVDYVVTVAVQTAAGSAAILSTFPALARPLGDTTTLLLIAVTATLIMCYVNLLGVRENGKTFAVPTYLFSASVGLMIIVGLYREALGGGLPHVTWQQGTVAVGHHPSGLLTFGAIYILGRAFANGGSSLTGIEAVSNAVSALRPPEGRNARQLLMTQGAIVAFLIAGISWLAHITHAVPYVSGFPTVLSQEAKLIFGPSAPGQVLYFLVQAGAITILFTGGNTSFSGFPFLTSFVAEDSFLPRWLSKRGHRLVFSNGIIVLTVLALALLLVVGANTNNLVPFYAIGVFTGFAMAGFGMARYHRKTKEPAWRRRLIINLACGVYTALVVVIFAVVKFTEGAWLVVAVFPVMVFLLIRLNRQYRREASVVEALSTGKSPHPPNFARRTVLVLVDDFDLAAIAALRYARSLHPTALRAVHFVTDQPRADHLLQQWLRADRGVPLDLVDCPHRRIERAAGELAAKETCQPGTHVTVLLPRRGTRPLLGRLLHDRTADKIAGVVSRIPRSAAMIVPFDVTARVEVLHEHQAVPNGKAKPGLPHVAVRDHDRPAGPLGVIPISSLTTYRRATVAGRVHSIEIRPVERNFVLAAPTSPASSPAATSSSAARSVSATPALS